jgi:hypothetical protein
MLKYGRIALVQGLSGRSGQVAFPHERAPTASGATGAGTTIEEAADHSTTDATEGARADSTATRAPRRGRRAADPRGVTERPSVR